MSEIIQVYRFLNDQLPSPDKRRLVLLTGARQTGKTTLARYKYPKLNYVNLDAPENREVVLIIPTALWGRDVGKALIDEAQKEPVVFEKVKYAFDEGSISFTLLLGSSQILLMKKIRESLAGRVSIYELWPLMMSELMQVAGRSSIGPPLIDRALSGSSFDEVFSGIPSVLFGKSDAVQRDAENFLLSWGGMPALPALKEDERSKWLKDYEYTYLERDLSDLARLSDLGPFRKFQRLSALRSGRLLSYSKLARDAGVSVDTARRYLEYLQISYQVILLQPYYKNITSMVIKMPKIYWLDIGLMRQLSVQGSIVSGEIYETMVIGELVKWIKTAQKEVEIYFYRTRSGLEIDGLLVTEHGIIGIETKVGENLSSSDIRAMKAVANALGKEWKGGLVVYRGNVVKKLSEQNIWAVPSRRLFT